MGVEKLAGDEQLALIGLAKLLIGADSWVSAEEVAYVAELSARMGPPGFFDAIEGATEAIADRGAVLRTATRVERPEARAIIFGELEALAEADGVVAAEKEILDFVGELWELREPPPGKKKKKKNKLKRRRSLFD